MDKYEVFSIEGQDNYKIISLDSINDIKTFNSYFWKADSINEKIGFVLKYDFESGEFNSSADNGIRVEGLPFECLIFDCSSRNYLRFYVGENYHLMDDNLNKLGENEINELIKKNILNYGYDPTLSETPKEAVIGIFLKKDQEISGLGPALKIIADGYLEFIYTKRAETGKNLDVLAKEFPLNIHLRQKRYPSDITPIIHEEIIPEDIIIDTTKLYENR